MVEDLYQRADSEARGYVNWKMFKQLLLSPEMSPFLQEQDVKEMQEQFKSSASNGKVDFNQFRVLAKELILRVYRAKDPSDVRNLIEHLSTMFWPDIRGPTIVQLSLFLKQAWMHTEIVICSYFQKFQ